MKELEDKSSKRPGMRGSSGKLSTGTPKSHLCVYDERLLMLKRLAALLGLIPGGLLPILEIDGGSND
jgi:hypothetical protein